MKGGTNAVVRERATEKGQHRRETRAQGEEKIEEEGGGEARPNLISQGEREREREKDRERRDSATERRTERRGLRFIRSILRRALHSARQ